MKHTAVRHGEVAVGAVLTGRRPADLDGWHAARERMRPRVVPRRGATGAPATTMPIVDPFLVASSHAQERYITFIPIIKNASG